MYWRVLGVVAILCVLVVALLYAVRSESPNAVVRATSTPTVAPATPTQQQSVVPSATATGSPGLIEVCGTLRAFDPPTQSNNVGTATVGDQTWNLSGTPGPNATSPDATVGSNVCLGGQLAQSETLPDLLIRWRLARSTAPTPSVVAPARPQGYALPTECQYVNGGSVDGGATTWKISCPEGLPSNYLQPSLAAQGWVTCGTKVWRKNGRQLAVIDAVNVSGFNGWLDQRPLSGANCTQATPPPNIGGSPP